MPPRIRQTSALPASISSTCSSNTSRRCQSPRLSARTFSQTCIRDRETRLRRDMWAWLNGAGRMYKRPVDGKPNYLAGWSFQETDDDAEGDGSKAQQDHQPFPLNKHFKSEPVLSEELREQLYKEVVDNKRDVRLVSAAYEVSMERVAAVVRMKTIEKDWLAKGKRLATFYSRAVLSMLPSTSYKEGDKPTPHESINDLIVHPATTQQLFYPASESRAFTREDAGKAFHADLLPADKRIPHPELVEMEREIGENLTYAERLVRAQAKQDAEESEKYKKEQARRKREEETVKLVPGGRWDFKFENISVESVGKDGRSPGGVGWRYGFPHEDRKRGQVKIPRSVE